MGERENLAPGLGSNFTLTLQPGTYVLNCTFQNDTRDNGIVTVTGAPTAKAASATDPKLTKAVDGLQGLRQGARPASSSTQTTAVRGRAEGRRHREGQGRSSARRASTTRRSSRSPRASATSTPSIDARVNDVDDRSKWTGFHKIEQILWRENTTKGTATLRRQAAGRRQDARRARSTGSTCRPPQIANGAVGLLDEVSASKITGEEDRYSHTDLSDFQGNFDGRQGGVRDAQAGARGARREQLVTEHRRPDRRGPAGPRPLQARHAAGLRPLLASSRRRTAASSPSRSPRWPSRCRSSRGRSLTDEQ